EILPDLRGEAPGLDVVLDHQKGLPHPQGRAGLSLTVNLRSLVRGDVELRCQVAAALRAT
ncbi:hypothetical protein, partial [Methylobacterium sp. E-046]|uniref:hypothetical protein n=1 Tax=Methylobacterium sp. E-046 TaxID=2836576 RepID=UPI001FBBD150